MDADPMKTCKNCGLRYDWRRSASRSLKMTYCNTLCEKADLGFTIDALLQSSTPRTAGEQLLAA